jgi:hypothetical protein
VIRGPQWIAQAKVSLSHYPASNLSENQAEKHLFQSGMLLMDCLYLEESGDSSEPSVNQPAPDFLAVEQEQEARRARLDEIRQLLLEQYRFVEGKKRFWMRNSPYPDLSDGVVERVISELELFTYTSEQLTAFISDFNEDPKQFHCLFSFLYKKP